MNRLQLLERMLRNGQGIASCFAGEQMEFWRTIGAQGGHGGTPVKMNKDGEILAGPKGMVGKKPEEISQSGGAEKVRSIDEWKPSGKSSKDFDQDDLDVIKEAGITKSQFDQLRSMLNPAAASDLDKQEIKLWHGTSEASAKSIYKSGTLNYGQRGVNATADIDHAFEYPESTGADSLVLITAKPDELRIDANDTPEKVQKLANAGKIRESVREDLFPTSASGRSSCEVGANRVLATFDVRNGVRRTEAAEAIKRGDLLEAIYHGVTPRLASKGLVPTKTKIP